MSTYEQTFPTPESHEGALNQVLTRAHSLNWEIIVYTLILVLALVTRFVDLGARVMSHDESLHTYYSWRLYEYGEFSHTPLMHGPVLFHMVALNYFLFGDNDFTARIYPAVLGILMVMYPLLLRRWLGRTGAILAAIMLLISPMVMFHNRYIREDTPSVFYTMIMVYAALQYVDGVRPRRSIWLWVLSGSLLLTLASKEVAFIYIAIFGSFMVLIWLMRMVQDVGVQRRPFADPDWRPHWLQTAIGQLILFAVALIIAVTMGRFLRFLLSPVLYISSSAWLELPLFALIYGPLAMVGLLNGSRAKVPAEDADPESGTPKRKRSGSNSDGVGTAIMRGLSNGKSAVYVIAAGLIIGAILALWIACVIDVVKPEQVWKQTVVRSDYDQLYGQNSTKEYAISTGFDGTNFVRLLTWIGLPTLVILFALFLTAVLRFPGDLPLPWREMLIVILIAFITVSVMMLVERRSFVATEDGSQPFAASLNTVSSSGNGYDNLPIIFSWVACLGITVLVVGTRVFTNWWNFPNRQPVFDVLIVIGTLVFPWLAAYPLWLAGYNLEEYNPNTVQGHDTLSASLAILIPFWLVSISVGLAWNWKRWLPAAAIFLGLFGFFYTTVFSNEYGLITGMIGSLGYWLEQQGVRRGSQPQYYYLLTQLPVYEFLPLLGTMCAGVFGLSSLWRWRRERAEADREALYELSGAEPVELGGGGPGPDDPEPTWTAETMVSATNETQVMTPESVGDAEPVPPGVSFRDQAGNLLNLPPRLAQPFDPGEEAAHRSGNPEWFGAFPFLAMVGWWAIAMLFGLTIAGEKMPWLATHLTVPMILITGWWLDRVIRGIRPAALDQGGWLVLIVALPLAFMAFGQVLLGFWDGTPFRGRGVQDLTASGNWLMALLLLLGALYLVGRFGRRIGLGQVGRLAIVSSALILAVLTLRMAIMACFINYDYPTEYLVYAHSGPAVKTTMSEIDRIATLTNEGYGMRIVFDDESSWPFTWYLRYYQNYGYLRGEAGSVDATSLDGARVVLVGSKKAGDVRRILGDRYYEFDYIRLWWPMQEYFNLSYDRVANVFSTDQDNAAARYYRKGIWDIWLNRDYQTYAQAMCIDAKQYQCSDQANQGGSEQERDQFRTTCQQGIITECANDPRFELNQWPVSDKLYVFVDKEIAAKIWDAGIGSSTVNIRAPEYAEDQVYQDIDSQTVLGENLGLLGPRGITVDADGLVYVADTEHNRVVVTNGQGELVSVIGTPASGSLADGALKQPWGLALGQDGNLYVADTWNNRIAVFSLDGTFLRSWGHEGVPGTDTSGEAMWGPRDIKIGPDGNVYVADTGGKRVRVYAPDGTFLRDIGRGGSGIGELNEPVGLAFNPISGELYVAESWNKRIQVFDLSGNSLRTFNVNMWFNNNQSYNRPYLAVSPDGTLIYVTDMDDKHRIVAYNLSGQPVISFNQPDRLDSGVLGVRSPAGMAFDATGRLYVVDADQAKVFVFPPSQVSGNIAPVPAVQDQPDLSPESSQATPSPTVDTWPAG